MNRKYAIGVDYGTQSGRAVLVDVSDGTVIAQSTKAYTHKVMEEYLPDGTRLPPDWALQHPLDYLEVLDMTIPAVLRESRVKPEDIIGLSIDLPLVLSCRWTRRAPLSVYRRSGSMFPTHG